MRRIVAIGFWCVLVLVALVYAQQPIANLTATNTADGSKVGLDVNLIGDAGDAFSGGTLQVDVVAVNGTAPLDAYTTATLQSAATASGNGSTLNVRGYGSVIFTVNCSVSCSGGTTINLEGSEDGTNYVALARAQRMDTGSISSAILNQSNAAATVWGAPVAGLQLVRARISGYSAGTVTVTATAVMGSLQFAPLTDPCATEAKTTTAFSQTSIANIISAASGKVNYVCSIVIVASAAEVVSVVEDDTSGCGSLTAALAGSTTAANGMSLAANGGFTLGSGNSTVLVGSAANRYLCIGQDGSDRISGAVTWVQR